MQISFFRSCALTLAASQLVLCCAGPEVWLPAQASAKAMNPAKVERKMEEERAIRHQTRLCAINTFNKTLIEFKESA